MQKKKVDVYQLVTDQIVESLEQGRIPWRKTWQGVGFARNYVTKHIYTGINTILTNLSPYEVPYFLTLKQANTLGGKVKRGAKSIPIIYWKIAYKDQSGTIILDEARFGENDLVKLFYARYYRVFNISDIDGIDFQLPEPTYIHDPIDQCERFITGIPSPPTIRFGGSQPYYAPPTDTVQMPVLNQFESPEAYYATFFHELVHSTGHVSRAMREEVMKTVKFGSLIYSQEELTAEIGAAFLCRIVGIDNPATFTNATAYIQGWLSKLKDDKKLIFQSATKAKQAVGYLVPS